MPTIKNKTNQIICLTDKGGNCVAIRPDESKQITKEMWDANKDMLPVKYMLENRQLLVINEAEPPASRPAPVAVPVAVPVEDTKPIERAAPEPEPAAEPSETVSFADLHWRTAKKLIAQETNVATLTKLLEGEERPSVKTMLEQRIQELEAA